MPGGVLCYCIEGRPRPPRPCCCSTRFRPVRWVSSAFPLAGRIFSAAGFNTMCELALYSERHVFSAFPRTFDDQQERTRRAKRYDPGAGGA